MRLAAMSDPASLDLMASQIILSSLPALTYPIVEIRIAPSIQAYPYDRQKHFALSRPVEALCRWQYLGENICLELLS